MLRRLALTLTLSIVILSGCGEPDLELTSRNATAARDMELAARATMSAAEAPACAGMQRPAGNVGGADISEVAKPLAATASGGAQEYSVQLLAGLV